MKRRTQTIRADGRAASNRWGLALLVGAVPACSTTTPPSGSAGGTESVGIETLSGDGSGGSDSGQSADGAGGDETDGSLFDVGGGLDLPPGTGCNGEGGGGGEESLEFSYIWIANSSEDTVSKIDTVTMQELGRYRTHPTFGNPSRTSVNLNGDVAVANRSGGLVKFYASVEDCEDRNGNGTIETSSGGGDVLPWGEEECMAWFTPFDYYSQRPVAWTAGEWNASNCRYENAMVWTSGATGDGKGGEGCQDPELCKGEGLVEVVLVDGTDGHVEEIVEIPEVIPQGFGLYGAAVDAEGNFWGSQLGQGDLVNVDLNTLQYEVFPMATSGYGMTVDAEGYVWTCSGDVGRFDPVAKTWQTASVGGSGGCMEDGNGTLWLASHGLVAVDTTTLNVIKTIPLEDGGGGGKENPDGEESGGYVHGVSVDFHGYVWGVSMGTAAYRVDPDTEAIDTFQGLVGPYTYSDMTGFALANAGGHTPAG